MSESCNHNQQNDMKKMCISKVPIFNHLEHKEMLEILKLSRQMKYQKGEHIYFDGDQSEYLYIVHIGRVKIYNIFESGKEQLLRILEPGEFMGELALFSNKVLDNYAEALENTEICAIHQSDMQTLMKTHPAISLKILSEFSTRLQEVEDLVGQLSNRDVKNRIASYLTKLSGTKNSYQIVLPMSKKDLASYLGTTQETISRRFAAFQTKGLIEQKGHRNIEILNYKELLKIADEE